jgi:hypothetical protein
MSGGRLRTEALMVNVMRHHSAPKQLFLDVLYRLYANERILFLTLPLFSSVVLASSKVAMGVVAHRRAIPQRACLASM